MVFNLQSDQSESVYKMSGAAGKRHQSGRNSRQVLMAALEEQLNKEPAFTQEEIDKVDIEEKIQLLATAVLNGNEKFAIVHNIVNDASDGLDPRTADCDERLLHMADENKQLRSELDILKGLFVKMEKENCVLREKVTRLNAAGMKDNLIINGICGDESTENAVEAVQEFLQDKMTLEFTNDQIISARRIGGYIPGKPELPRAMLTQIKPDLRDSILSNLKKLKGKKNTRGRGYRIARQLPDEWNEERRKLDEQVQKARKDNDAKPDTEQKDIIEVKKRTLYINKAPQKKYQLTVPGPADLFPDKQEQEKLDKIKFCTSSIIEEEGSKFQAYALKLQSLTEIKRAYVRIKQLHPSATHVPAVYSIKSYDGFQDDKEYGAAHRILDVVTQNNHTNVAVFTVRYHHGPNLGPKRHKLYERAVTEALARIKK